MRNIRQNKKKIWILETNPELHWVPNTFRWLKMCSYLYARKYKKGLSLFRGDTGFFRLLSPRWTCRCCFWPYFTSTSANISWLTPATPSNCYPTPQVVWVTSRARSLKKPFVHCQCLLCQAVATTEAFSLASSRMLSLSWGMRLVERPVIPRAPLLLVALWVLLLVPSQCFQGPPTWRYISSEVVNPQKEIYHGKGFQAPGRLSYSLRFRGQRPAKKDTYLAQTLAADNSRWPRSFTDGLPIFSCRLLLYWLPGGDPSNNDHFGYLLWGPGRGHDVGWPCLWNQTPQWFTQVWAPYFTGSSWFWCSGAYEWMEAHGP